MIGSARLTQFNQPTDQAIVATGGTITTFNDGTNTYKVHKFTTAGTDSFVVSSSSGNIDVLVVGGGGEGAYAASYTGAPGGGAGKVVYQTGIAVTAQTYNITVGASASSSQAFGITATAGQNGNSTTNIGGTSGNGFAGGIGDGDFRYYGGGGGGASSSGSSLGNKTDGGAGIAFTNLFASGTQVYGGGGGGGSRYTAGIGGSGGGGNGGRNVQGSAGTANTGGGGGGGGDSLGTLVYGGAGGSGIVIIRYKI